MNLEFAHSFRLVTTSRRPSALLRAAGAMVAAVFVALFMAGIFGPAPAQAQPSADVWERYEAQVRKEFRGYAAGRMGDYETASREATDIELAKATRSNEIAALKRYTPDHLDTPPGVQSAARLIITGQVTGVSKGVTGVTAVQFRQLVSAEIGRGKHDEFAEALRAGQTIKLACTRFVVVLGVPRLQNCTPVDVWVEEAPTKFVQQIRALVQRTGSEREFVERIGPVLK